MSREYLSPDLDPKARRNRRLTVDDVGPVESILQVADRSPDWIRQQLSLKEEQPEKSVSDSNKKKSSGVSPIVLFFGLAIGGAAYFLSGSESRRTLDGETAVEFTESSVPGVGAKIVDAGGYRDLAVLANGKLYNRISPVPSQARVVSRVDAVPKSDNLKITVRFDNGDTVVIVFDRIGLKSARQSWLKGTGVSGSR